MMMKEKSMSQSSISLDYESQKKGIFIRMRIMRERKDEGHERKEIGKKVE